MKSITGFLVLCLVTNYALGQSDINDAPKPVQSLADLRQQLEKILKETGTPGMAVAIVNRDGPEWTAGLGEADISTGRAASAETLFRIGSVSKAFVSFSILKLANEGRLSFEDPVHKLAPGVWFENPWEASDPVRVVDLLEHTTGWDDMHPREFGKDAPALSLSDALNYDHHSRTSRWRPGTRSAYSNSGPSVAAYIVERITGRRFEDYVRENFFEPIGMKTATYFQPSSALLTTLYHRDGRTPYPYWNLLYRPMGAINASANDMAACLQFYLNRGTIKGKVVMPPSSIDRMEIPSRSWAAKEGLRTGYALGNFAMIREGFVYHGHNGAVPGDLTEMEYLPDYGEGYFYSINSGNIDAFTKVGRTIRAYVTRNLEKPTLPPVPPLSASDSEYEGWYRNDSPRVEMTHFLEFLFGLVLIRFQDGKLIAASLAEPHESFIPVTSTQFRRLPNKDAPEPVSTVELLKPNGEGRFIQFGNGKTLKRATTSLAVTQILLSVWFVLAVVSVLLYAPIWLLAGISKRRRRPAERGIRLWPLFAVLAVLTFVVTYALASDEPFSRLGNRTPWSVILFLATILYGVTALGSIIALGRAWKEPVRTSVWSFSVAVTLALLIGLVCLAWWGILGLRTWA